MTLDLIAFEGVFEEWSKYQWKSAGELRIWSKYDVASQTHVNDHEGLLESEAFKVSSDDYKDIQGTLH